MSNDAWKRINAGIAAGATAVSGVMAPLSQGEVRGIPSNVPAIHQRIDANYRTPEQQINASVKKQGFQVTNARDSSFARYLNAKRQNDAKQVGNRISALRGPGYVDKPLEMNKGIVAARHKSAEKGLSSTSQSDKSSNKGLLSFQAKSHGQTSGISNTSANENAQGTSSNRKSSGSSQER